MVKIWGFDLSEMHWGAFGHEQMFDKRWHLRKQRFIIYQLAMLTGLAAECTATYSLSKYNLHQSHIEAASAFEYNEDLIRSAISTIVFCVFVATLFGADFFFLVFWPRRRYPGWYHRAKKALAVVVTLGVLGSAVASTITIATGEARIWGVDAATTARLVQQFARPPLRYRDWAQNIAWVVLLWIAFVFTAASTYLMFKASAYDQRTGTEPLDESTHRGLTRDRDPERVPVVRDDDASGVTRDEHEREGKVGLPSESESGRARRGVDVSEKV